MSYNYEINYNISRKKSEQSKYTYRTVEDDSQIFIFELVLKNTMNESNTIRKLMKHTTGGLITLEDNIMYTDIEKFKLTIIDINFPDKPIVIKQTIDHNLSTNVFLNENVYIEINQTFNNNMLINYTIGK
jgi:hypothetical protein